MTTKPPSRSIDRRPDSAFSAGGGTCSSTSEQTTNSKALIAINGKLVKERIGVLERLRESLGELVVVADSDPHP